MKRLKIKPIPSLKPSMCLLEVVLGLYMLKCAHLSIQVDGTIVSLPFLLLFAAGYLYVGITSLGTHLRGCFGPARPASAQAT